jgi:predicted aspartyl protease
MITYDSIYHAPPAPMARVTLRNLLNGKAVLDVPMLIDTGADISVVLRVSAENIGLQSRRDESIVIVAYDGSRRSSEVVTLEMVLEDYTFEGDFLVRDDVIGVIGRNVLNQFFITLDGRGRAWSLELR